MSRPPTNPIPASPRHRWWLPVTIWVLIAAIAGFLALRPELERNVSSWLLLALIGVGVLLTLGWFALLSGFSGRLRATVAVTVMIVSGGGYFSVRTDGTFSSIGFPRLAWRWSEVKQPSFSPPAPPEAVPAVPPEANIPDAPQFLGAQRDGVVRGVRLARDWSGNAPRELWRQPVGAAWSSFAVAGGRACTLEQRGGEEVLTCYDVRSGRLLWALAHPAHFTQWQGGEGPRSTPTIDQGLVFAYGATGILECAELATGKRVWSRDVLAEYALGNLEWGLSASPLVVADTVVVSGGARRGPTLLSFDRRSGIPKWQAGGDRASYSSPVLATIAGRQVILSFNAATLTAHDPGTGRVLLSHPWSEEKIPKAAQPVLIPGDRVFLSAGYGAGCALLQLTAGPGNNLEASVLWKSLRMKNQFNTVATRDGMLYGLDDGMLACVDIATGERKWKEGRYGSGQTLLVNDLILIQAEAGPVILAEVRPAGAREIGRLAALSGKTWNHPQLAGRYLLVRNDREAVAYELPLE